MYGLFSDVCSIAAKPDSRRAVELALADIVRELHAGSATAPNEAIGEATGTGKMFNDFAAAVVPDRLIRHFGVMPSQAELYNIAQSVRDLVSESLPALTREHRREKGPLLRWYHSHWVEIEPCLSRVDFPTVKD
jgi:hypothetical protein